MYAPHDDDVALVLPCDERGENIVRALDAVAQRLEREAAQSSEVA